MPLTNKTHTTGFLSGNALKILAAISMLIDHVGLMFFPRLPMLRILGRLAFPVFAFMIAEGCKYTKNKLRYFLSVFVLAAVCQTVYFFFDGSLYMSVLVTFSLSILMIYALQNLKNALSGSLWQQIRAAVILLLSVAAVYGLNALLTIDYGFWGCMVPVFASLFQQGSGEGPGYLKKLDRKPFHILSLGVGLVLLAIADGGNQFYSLLALPLLMLYSGARGKWRMKYFFYIFYPLHLAALQGIYILLH